MSTNDELIKQALDKLKADFAKFDRSIQTVGRGFNLPITSALTTGFSRFTALFAGFKRDLSAGQLYYLSRDLDRAGRSVQVLGLKLKLLGVAFTAALLSTVSQAARVESSFTRQGLLLGDAAGAAENYVQTLSRATNRTGLFVRESLNSFQAFFQGLDFGTEKATEFAQAVTKLQLDFAAAAGQTSEESMRRFIAALAGSPEVLDQFGIDLKELSLNAVLAAHGIDGVRQATEKQKTLARLLLIYDRLGKQGAIDAAVKTMTNFATILDQVRGQTIELKAAIGNQLKPALIEISKFLNAVGATTKEWIKVNGDLVKKLLIVGATTTAVGGAIIGLGTALRLAAFSLSGFAIFAAIPGFLLTVVSGLFSLATILPSVLGPVLGLAAGVGVLVVAFKNWDVISRVAVGSVSSAFATLKGTFLDASQAIRNAAADMKGSFLETLNSMAQAVRGGNVGLAMEILTVDMQMAWKKLTEVMQSTWDSSLKFIITQTETFKDKINEIFKQISGPEWLEAIGKTTSGIKKFFQGVYKLGERLQFGDEAGGAPTLKGIPQLAIPSQRTRQLLFGGVPGAQALQDYLFRGQQEKERYAAQVAEEQATTTADMLDFLRMSMDPDLTQAAIDTFRKEGNLEVLSEALKILADQIPQPGAPNLAKTMESISAELGKTAAAIGEAFGVQGGFADQIVTGLTGNKADKDIAKNTAETAKNTADMNQKLSKLQGAFGQ